VMAPSRTPTEVERRHFGRPWDSPSCANWLAGCREEGGVCFPLLGGLDGDLDVRPPKVGLDRSLAWQPGGALHGVARGAEISGSGTATNQALAAALRSPGLLRHGP